MVTEGPGVVGRVGVQLHAQRVRVEAPEVYLDGDTPLDAASLRAHPAEPCLHPYAIPSALLPAHRQHGARGTRNHTARHTAEHYLGESAPAVGSDHHEIGPRRSGRPHDPLVRDAVQ